MKWRRGRRQLADFKPEFPATHYRGEAGLLRDAITG